MRRGTAIALTAATIGLLASAAPAQGAYHLMQIREVATNPAGADSAFLELQMYAAGQNFTGGHSITFYTATGSLLGTMALTNVPNGGDQRSILIGDVAVSPAPDISYPMMSETVQTYGPGGAACFDTVDCVSWGAFTGAASLPSPAGSPAPAIPNGSSLTRSIAAGCATLLEAGDDTNNGAADFALAPPSPRNNATAPTETACGGSRDDDPPQTTITKEPPKRTGKAKAKLKFKSSEPGSTFECKLDKGRYKTCRSPRKLKRLDDGKHKFRVRATDPAGNTDPTPDKAKWKVTG